MRCILLEIEALFGVSATTPWELPECDEMHPAHYCSITWIECRQDRNSKGLVRCILLIIVALPGVNAAKAWEFREFGEMHPVPD